MSSLNLSGSSSSSASNEKLYKKLQKSKYDESMLDPGTMSIDDAVEWAGDNSNYHKRTSLIFSFQYAISSFLLMGLSLLLVKPTFYCQNPDGTETMCKETEACKSGNFRVDQEESENTIALTFKLYCDRNYIIGWIGSLMFICTCLAGFCFPYIANWRGRKAGLLLASIMSSISLIVIGFSPSNSIWVVMVFIALAGFAFSGFEIVCFVYTAEVAGDRFRNYAIATLGTVWAAAQIIIGPLFAIAGNWRVICIVLMALPTALSLYPMFKYVFETPRFLYSIKQYQQTKDVINNICIVNKKPRFRARLEGEDEKDTTDYTFEMRRQRTTSLEIRASHISGYLELFKDPKLRKVTLALMFIWFFRNFTYYGLNFSLPTLGTEVYMNFTIAAFAETAANLLAGRINMKVGRILSLTGSVALVCVSCLVIIFFPIPEECYLSQEGCYQKVFSILFAIIAKFCISFFANVLITYTSENYPTEVRPQGLGLCIATGRLGAVAMSFVIAYMGQTKINPLFSFGVLGLIALILIFFLPETYGRIMKDFMVEMKPHTVNLLRISEKSNRLEESFE